MTRILLLLLLSLVTFIQAAEIPSFEQIRNTSSFGCNQKDATFFAFRNHLIANENMPVEDIEPILTSWFKENPELYDYANGYVDYLLVGLIITQCNPIQQKAQETNYVARSQEILRVLKNLNIEQTVSNKFINLVAKLVALKLLRGPYCHGINK